MTSDEILAAARDALAHHEAEAEKLRRVVAELEGKPIAAPVQPAPAIVPQYIPTPMPYPWDPTGYPWWIEPYARPLVGPWPHDGVWIGDPPGSASGSITITGTSLPTATATTVAWPLHTNGTNSELQFTSN